MKYATAMLTPKLINTDLHKNLVTYLNDKKIKVKTRQIDNSYFEHKEEYLNCITWGVRIPRKSYISSGQNILYLENGLLHQEAGIYVDHRGYFSDSSLVTNKNEYDKATPYDIMLLKEHFERHYRVAPWEMGYDPNGPFIIIMQMNADAPMSFQFPMAGKTHLRNKIFLKTLAEILGCEKEVIVRIHPREAEFPTFPRPKTWTIQASGNLFDTIRKCSGLITVNSTVATESMMTWIPIATYGLGTFTGRNITLDCSNDYQKVKQLESYQVNKMAITDYVVNIYKHHNIPYKSEDFFALFEANRSIQHFINNAY
jgi:hypothetical protein